MATKKKWRCDSECKFWTMVTYIVIRPLESQVVTTHLAWCCGLYPFEPAATRTLCTVARVHQSFVTAESHYAWTLKCELHPIVRRCRIPVQPLLHTAADLGLEVLLHKPKVAWAGQMSASASSFLIKKRKTPVLCVHVSCSPPHFLRYLRKSYRFQKSHKKTPNNPHNLL